ncbi:SMI1/KNR4 family protein [Asanoa sp. NPDC049518]|uniref:SMI1/KNR4 family protein n=1 Tax=unclassified Asanoa TaxID=2685164 RepID=UPI00341365CA
MCIAIFRSGTIAGVRKERLGFAVESVQAVAGGWRLEGEPDYHPRHWARPGDRFDRAYREHGRAPRDVDLVVVELTGSFAVVSGVGGELLRPDDLLSGERVVDRAGALPEPADAAKRLPQILGLAARASATRNGCDWSPVETELGVVLPNDYKTFVDAHGAGSVDDHVIVCVPDATQDWANLVRHNTWAYECVRLDFAGPDSGSGHWALGDASRWTPDREDVPSWFAPGDNLISWGCTGNGDFLFWHVRPGVAPDDWPVVLKEEGPLWERYGVGFAATLVGLLTGDIQSEYLSRWLGGPHSYAP